MRRLLLALALLVLVGCTPQQTDDPYVVTEPPTILEDPGNAVEFSIQEKPAISVLSWKATVKNTSDKQSTALIIDCVDAAGKILAEDQVRCVLSPNEFSPMKGDMDIPTEIIPKIKAVTVKLIAGSG